MSLVHDRKVMVLVLGEDTVNIVAYVGINEYTVRVGLSRFKEQARVKFLVFCEVQG